MAKNLAQHYYPGPEHTGDCQQIIVEWQKAQYGWRSVKEMGQ